MKEQSLTTRIVEELRAKIRSNELAPGTRLSLSGLAEQLKVSRAVVRAALVRLVAENRVVLQDAGHYFVRQADAGNMAESSELRKIIESGCLRLAFHSAGQAWIDSLTEICSDFSEAVKAGDFGRAATLDLHFHHVLVEAAGNGKLKQLYAACDVEALQQVVAGSLNDAHDYQIIDSEHRSIVAALSNRNLREAEMLLLKHLDCTSIPVIQLHEFGS